jgi:hypothetical protein
LQFYCAIDKNLSVQSFTSIAAASDALAGPTRPAQNRRKGRVTDRAAALPDSSNRARGGHPA